MGIEDSRAPSVGLGELRHLAEVHSRVIETLTARGLASTEELSGGRRLLAFINKEIERRVMAPRVPPHEAIWPAIASWDLLRLEVKPSHRAAVGGLVTSTKRVVAEGLRPAHARLLEPQRDFNQHLLDFIVWSIDGRFPSGVGLSTHVRSTLSSLQNRIKAVKPNGVSSVLAHVMSPALKQQREWNAHAMDLLFTLLEESGGSPGPDVHFALGEMMRLSRFPLPEDMKGLSRVTFPMWVELLRKQQVFNESVTRTLTSLFGLPLQPDDGRAWYPATILSREARRARQAAQQVADLEWRPMISVITPTFRADRTVLRKCVDSLLAQSYERWELCLVDDGSPDAETQYFVESLAELDPRIRVRLMPRNGGIAVATNEALAMATGEYVAFLDHDDTISEHALAEVVLYLAKHPETDFLYTDEDRLDSAERRVVPFFKPDWSPDLLRACNYICHFLVAKRSIVEEVGRVRTGFDGAQDYDLALRMSEVARSVGHISEVLYHWRATPDSTASNIANKPKAGLAGIRALAEHLDRCGERGTIHSPIPTHYKISYEVQRAHALVVVAGSSKVAHLKEGLENTAYEDHELCLVSKYPTANARHIQWNGPVNIGAMYEAAWRGNEADVYVFMHEDTAVIDMGWLGELIGQALRPGIGVVGPKLVNPNSTIQDAGWVVGSRGDVVRPFENMADAGEWTTMGSPDWTRNYLAVSPACFAVSRRVLEKVGGFSSEVDNSAAVFDLCARVRAHGLRVLYTPHARVLHFSKSPRPEELVQRLTVRVGQTDPFFNPNLSLRHSNGMPRVFDEDEES